MGELFGTYPSLSNLKATTHFNLPSTPGLPSSTSLRDCVSPMNSYREQDSPDLNPAGCSPAELEECRALRAFYRAFRGKRWHRKDGWSTPNRDAPQVCLNGFEGVTVHQGGCASEIRLPSNGLSTFKTRERGWRTLRSLRYLTVLNLRNNSLQGMLHVGRERSGAVLKE